MISWRGNWIELYGGLGVIESPTLSADKLTLYVGLDFRRKVKSIEEAEEYYAEVEILSDGTLVYSEKSGYRLETEIKKGQKLTLRPEYEPYPKKNYRVIVEVNPLLYTVANVQWNRVVEVGTSGVPIYCTFTKNFDLSELEYLVRYYLEGK